jgi:hypothetical protein
VTALVGCSSNGHEADPTASPAGTSGATATTSPPAPNTVEPTTTANGGTSSDRTPTTEAGSVQIASDVFNWADTYMTFSNESILVTGSASDAALVEALNRAAARFMHVDETGVEHGAEVEESPPVGADGEVLYTPNYVSTPEVTPAGIRMYVDCKGVIEPAMRVTFLEILTQELALAGGDVSVAVAR